MRRTFLRSKIHKCTLTGTFINYEGSISIDESLMESAGIMPYEQVQIVNITNGERLTTYAIPVDSGSKRIELNGAAARLGEKGDELIIMAFAELEQEEINTHFCTVAIMMEGSNTVKSVCNKPVVTTQA